MSEAFHFASLRVFACFARNPFLIHFSAQSTQRLAKAQRAVCIPTFRDDFYFLSY